MSTDIAVESAGRTDTTANGRPPDPERTHWIAADPVPAGVALFAFAVTVFSVRFVDVNITTLAAGPITVGLNYAVLVGAIGETIFGILAVIKGQSYPGYVLSVFGIWLWGFFFLTTSGAASKAFTPDAVAWYALLLDIPLIILAVPAFVKRNRPFMIAFVALIVLFFFVGLGFHDLYSAINTATATKAPPKLSAPVSLLKVSAYAGFVAAAALFWVFGVDVYKATGVLKG